MEYVPKIHYMKPFLMVLMVSSWWIVMFVMVFVVETIRFAVMFLLFF